MVDYSSYPMDAYAWGDPDVDLENPRFVISVEWTWPAGDWTHFSLVRSTRSPVRRREEGQVMMTTKGQVWDHFAYQTTGQPVYRDPQPPPGEWVYYTAFVLDENRIWNYAGTVYEVSIEDYNWALQLPELMPGVAIADSTRTASPAEQSNTLVQFLQTPGALLDKTVTMAEAVQYFWDPLKVPPQMLRALGESLGYAYDEVLGTGRVRYVLDALMGPKQGSLPAIQRFAAGATGCTTFVDISNNLMLDVNDSSFENGELTQLEVDGTTTTVTKWQPLGDLELRQYENWTDAVAGGSDPTLHPNVLIDWFLYLKAAGTYTCGPNYQGSDPNPDIAEQGIPVAAWTVARMGVHAYKPSATAATITMGLRLYDYLGGYMKSLIILPTQTLTEEWKWYPSAVEGISVSSPANYYNLLSANQASVETNTNGFTVNANVTLSRSTAQAADGAASLGMTCTSTNQNMIAYTSSGVAGVPVTAGVTYTATVSLRAATVGDNIKLDILWWDAAGAALSPTVGGSAPLDTTTGWTALTTTGTAPVGARFAALAVTVFSVALNSVHYADKFGFWEGTGTTWGMPGAPISDAGYITDVVGTAYAVPWITVSNPCSVDLFVVDDG